MKKLSIIIPVYNVEKYVAKCLNSILEQFDDNHVEIVIVNDGSTDNSNKIVQETIEGKKGITYVLQENQGLSVARNVGLKYSRGTYVWFIDSDDYLSEGAIGKVLSIIDNKDADVYAFLLNAVDEKTGKKYLLDSTHLISKKYSGLEYFYQGGFTSAVTRFIIKKEVLMTNDLRFKSGIYHEDNEFIPRLYYYASSVMHFNFALYNYLLRDSGSITASFKIKRCVDLLEIANIMIDFSQKNMEKKYHIVYLSYALSQINYALDVLSKGSKKQKNEFLQIYSHYIRKQNIRLLLFNRGGYKKVIWSIIAIISPSLYLKLKSL